MPLLVGEGSRCEAFRFDETVSKGSYLEIIEPNMKGFSVGVAYRTCVVTAVALLVLSMPGSSPWTEAAGNFKTVVIDVGHGGHDKGAATGLIYEKHLALDTARRLDAYLRKKGVRTVMTRSRDNYVSLPSRCYIANRESQAIFVSIHYNQTRRTAAKGIETFYASDQGHVLGNRVHGELIGRLKPEDRGLKWHQYYVLRNTRVPAVLVECGFLSNSWERKRCLEPGYRQLVAESIGDGILSYKGQR